MDEHAVEDLTSLFIGVEALVDEMPQEAATLRDAETVRHFQRGDGRRIVLAVTDEVADGRQAGANDSGVFCGVDDFVDLAGDEATVEVDGQRIDEAPLLSGNDPPRRILRLTHAQRCVGSGEVVDGEARSSDNAEDYVRYGLFVAFAVYDEIGPDPPAHAGGDR